MVQAGDVVLQRFVIAPPGGVVLHYPVLGLLHGGTVEGDEVGAADFLALD